MCTYDDGRRIVSVDCNEAVPALMQQIKALEARVKKLEAAIDPPKKK